MRSEVFCGTGGSEGLNTMPLGVIVTLAPR